MHGRFACDQTMKKGAMPFWNRRYVRINFINFQCPWIQVVFIGEIVQKVEMNIKKLKARERDKFYYDKKH